MTVIVLLILFVLLVVLAGGHPKAYRGVMVIKTNGLADDYVPPSASLAPPVVKDIDD